MNRDACELCHGERGGEPGNENIIAGVVVCDYCHADGSYLNPGPRSSVVVACLITFLSATAFDGLLAQWVAAVAAHRAVLAAALSMACATTTLLGFGQAMKGRWPAITWVLGYGLGSWLAVTFGAHP